MLVLTMSDIQAVEGTDTLTALGNQMRSTSALALTAAAMAQDELITRSRAAEERSKRSRVEAEESAKRALLEMEKL
jgi:hypothetical protein